MKKEFKDSYCTFIDNTLVIGNSLVERSICLENNIPISKYFLNKATNYKWESSIENKIVLCNIPGFDFCESNVTVEITNDAINGLSNTCLMAKLTFKKGNEKVLFHIWIFPEDPFISTALTLSDFGNAKIIEADMNNELFDGNENKVEFAKQNGLILPPIGTIDAVGSCEKHVSIKAIELYDVTDHHNTLLKEHEDLLYVRRSHKFNGQMFIIDAYLKDEAIMIVKEAPCSNGRLIQEEYDVSIESEKSIEVFGAGVDFANLPKGEYIQLYYSTTGVGKKESLPSYYKKHYNNMCSSIGKKGTYSMSNTWGDRNQDGAICEDFIKKEILAASDLGVNVLQIDDGWQKGITANSALAKGGAWGSGYYDADIDFWKPSPAKFPNGFNVLSDLAEKQGVKLGLWFSPDLNLDYVNWEKDAITLLGLWKDYGVSYFKLDGIDLTTKLREINLMKMIRLVLAESNNQITFNFDITAQKRWGYLFMKEIGNIFVENRYTDWGTYYPHTTLRNLWHLSKYLPTGKFQLEFLNLRRNEEVYGSNNPLSPSNYGIDYAFATTMFANPLFWMEVSNLDVKDKKTLSIISKIYNKYSKDIARSIISPIGQMPNGISFTGFIAENDEKSGYLLLFRELCPKDEYVYEISCLANKPLDFEIIYTNSEDVLLAANAQGILFRTSKARSFAFVKFNLS